jgi:hypothetical protein
VGSNASLEKLVQDKFSAWARNRNPTLPKFTPYIITPIELLGLPNLIYYSKIFFEMNKSENR